MFKFNFLSTWSELTVQELVYLLELTAEEKYKYRVYNGDTLFDLRSKVITKLLKGDCEVKYIAEASEGISRYKLIESTMVKLFEPKLDLTTDELLYIMQITKHMIKSKNPPYILLVIREKIAADLISRGVGSESFERLTAKK